MDPQACLVQASEHLYSEGERTECAERLNDYFQWRMKGGFQPPNGDYRAAELLVKIGGVADTLSEFQSAPRP